MRILIVEDERALADAIVQLVNEAGIEADVEATVFAGIEAALAGGYDCLVVDVGLLDGSGLDLVSELRSLGLRTPILVLTVHNEPVHRVEGLNRGADDYMGKPFDRDELLARIHALVRRASGSRETETMTYGDAVLHRKSRTLQHGERVLELSSKEFLLMEYLFRHPSQVLSRDQLVAHLWGPDAEVAPNALDNYVYFLRKKCHRVGLRQFIRTVRGEGYQLAPPPSGSGGKREFDPSSPR